MKVGCRHCPILSSSALPPAQTWWATRLISRVVTATGAAGTVSPVPHRVDLRWCRLRIRAYRCVIDTGGRPLQHGLGAPGVKLSKADTVALAESILRRAR